MFDHEKLRVYQTSLEFAAWVETILEHLPKSTATRDQLDRASSSILLNIAEGNGRHTETDRCRFFDMARGSALECAACLDLLMIKKVATKPEIEPGKQLLVQIVSMLIGLIRSNSTARLHDEPVSYRVESKTD